ncbi:MAG: hypothetical protein ABL923_03020 [Burkholderiaceae bacterium]
MKKRIFTLLSFSLLVLLTGCMGIPLSSLPRLVKLPEQLLTLKPAEFMLAIQTDSRMLPPAGASPTLDITIQPKNVGDYAPVDKKIPMQLAELQGVALGLERATSGRRWLIYSFPAASQAELAAIQTTFKRIKAENDAKGSKGDGSLTVGIAQQNIATADAALDNTRWESWLQTSAKDGFFELWSGTVKDIKVQAKKAAK